MGKNTSKKKLDKLEITREDRDRTYKHTYIFFLVRNVFVQIFEKKERDTTRNDGYKSVKKQNTFYVLQLVSPNEMFGLVRRKSNRRVHCTPSYT